MEAHVTLDIDDFPAKRDCISPPSFFGVWDGQCVEWALDLYPEGYDVLIQSPHLRGYVSIALVQLSTYSPGRALWCKVSCIDSSGEVVVMGESNLTFPALFITAGEPATTIISEFFLRRDTILDEKNRILIEGHKLRIHCCLSDKKEMPFCLEIGNKELCTKNSYTGFWEHYQEQKFVDCTISVGAKNFQAHKIMLAGRSEVFAKMFEHDFKENATNTIHIDDFEPRVVEAMLRFIYLDDVDNEDVSSDLLLCAEKYALTRLKFLCARRLLRTLSVDTAAHVLLTANLCDAPHLKSLVVSYIADHWREIKKKANWSELFNHQHLIEAIFEVMSPNY